jgi:hypothetical protein
MSQVGFSHQSVQDIPGLQDFSNLFVRRSRGVKLCQPLTTLVIVKSDISEAGVKDGL